MPLSPWPMQIAAAWRGFWFRDADTVPLERIRIGLGLALLLSYGGLSAELFTLYGDEGWLGREFAASYFANNWAPSVFRLFDQPWQWVAFHGLFLAACAALALGWRTSVAKWIVLVGHLSYAHRNVAITYGVDSMAASLLVILCLAPIGGALSLDHRRRVRRAEARGADCPPVLSAWGHACLRLLQIQMAIAFLFAGLTKIRGDLWWHGDALWVAMMNYEYANVPAGWLAEWYVLVNLFTYGTLAVEIAYPFLIWNRRLGPWMLAAAIALHVGIAGMMGLVFFSAVMILGHCAFLPREAPVWLRARSAGLLRDGLAARGDATGRDPSGLPVGSGHEGRA